jgi:acyl dehydratase
MALTMVKPEEMEAQAGTKLPPGEWFEIDQERINTFADCTEDHQFIHIDEAAAAQTPFGGTIAHGFLTLSLMTKLCAEVRAHTEIMSVDRKDANRFLVKQAVTVEIEGEDTPAVYAEWLGMSIIG